MAEGTLEIALEGLEFFAHHGFYEEERLRGNNFTVDVKVVILYNELSNTEDIHATVNYEGLCQVAEAEMGKTVLLLETVASNIIDALFLRYPQLLSAEVSVAKHYPPIPTPCAKSRVTLRRGK